MMSTPALIAILALVSIPTPSASQGAITLPLTIPSGVINSHQAVCPLGETEREVIVQDIRNAIHNTIIPAALSCRSAQTQATPAASCSALPTSCSSSYYWIRSSNGTAVRVYCDMNRVCGCSSTGGWTRIANLNMSDPSQQCPGAWNLQTYSTAPMRLCVGSHATCVSAMYSTYGISYSQVCGRVIGYQYHSTDAFGQHGGWYTIDGPYVDGVSLTHGPPGTRQHIWTFAAGLLETVPPDYPDASCPCAGRASLSDVPSFVGNDYICESGNSGTTFTNVLHASDPLWDGQGCGSPPCCELSYPPGVTAPWFCKQLPQATADDTELRICVDQPGEGVLVELVELYIH